MKSTRHGSTQQDVPACTIPSPKTPLQKTIKARFLAASSRFGCGCLAALLLAASATPALADRYYGRGGWHGDIHRFEHRDLHHWRGGYWHHGPHRGRLGWWWVVGGIWYFYPTPVYPYPDPYVPPVVVQQPPQPPVVVQQPPTTAAPSSQVWYYCDERKGYYPYVPTCPSGWRVVPATPSDVAR